MPAPVTKPPPKSATKPTAKPATKPTANPATKPTANPATKPTTNPATNPPKKRATKVPTKSATKPPPELIKTAAEKLEEENKSKMRTIVDNMKRSEPVMIKMGADKECPMPSDMLSRMKEGEKMTPTDWKRVTDLLLPKHAPNAIVSIGANCTLPPLKTGEFGIWLRQMPVRGVRRTLIWGITTYGLPDNGVNIYCVRAATGLQENLDPVASAVGVAEYMLHPSYYQVCDL
ncbi:hypothetical protein J1614_001253 [Plenodomus biglobosus]|nr:hypothetical protein J1614_001253 [Plenodomus biglobosus]